MSPIADAGTRPTRVAPGRLAARSLAPGDRAAAGTPITALVSGGACEAPRRPVRSIDRTGFLARLAAVMAAAAVLVHATGCAPHRAPSPPPPPAGYVARVDPLTLVDSLEATGRAPFAGRRVAIDPGHGGFFRGSLGVNGLAEAEVNLGVALALRDMLVAKGADVMLTRETDRDFLTTADSSLRSDLDARVRLANAFRPDLFVSVHHNADASGSHTVNETQTYWKLTDEGPSFEAAEDVHRSLVRNLGIGANKLLPGNYAVLRASEAPAILTESSYLTYPPTEAKLRDARALRLEAEALYLGIARYFARQRPEIERFDVVSSDPGLPAERTDPFPRIEASVRGAFDAAELRLDGAPVALQQRGGELLWRSDAPLGAGPHEATLRVRLAGEGSARVETRSFVVGAPAVRLELDAPYQVDGVYLDDFAVGLRARVLDAWGRMTPVPVRVRFQELDRRVVSPGDTTAQASSGEAWAYVLPYAAWRAHHFKTIPSTPFRIAASLLDSAGAVVATDTLRFAAPPEGTPRPDTYVGFALVDSSGAPLANAPGTLGRSADDRVLNRDGFGRFSRGPAANARVERVPGWRHVPASDPAAPGRAPRFAPLFGGALHGRRIAIDPAGSGDVPGVTGADPAGAGPSGTRAANVNLEVARALASMLTAAGAEVLLVRDSPAPVLDVERVRRSEAFGAERYLRIGHGPHAPRLGHYYSSAAGRRWAGRTARALEALGMPAVAPAEDAQWALQQTSCPALYASLARIDDAAGESSLLAPGAVRREAYALLAGLALEWSADRLGTAGSLTVTAPDGRPVAGAVVTVGDGLMLESDARGVVRFLRSEPGALEVTAARGTRRARALLLDSQRGAVIHFTP